MFNKRLFVFLLGVLLVFNVSGKITLASLPSSSRNDHLLRLSLGMERQLKGIKDNNQLPEDSLLSFLFYPKLVC